MKQCNNVYSFTEHTSALYTVATKYDIIMLSLYNTATKQKEPFSPLDDHTVGLYTCGPTVYNYAHIGNLRTYVFEDILHRTLKYHGYDVTHVMNITDVGHLTDDGDNGEDKMEKGAKREGKTAWEISDYYTKMFKEDMKALNILEPTIWCKATDHIPEQITQVQTLIDAGHTYETSDGIYFDTTTIDDYGKLANLKNQDLEAGSRVEMGEKKNPHDFALWKFNKPGEKRQMEWEAFGKKGFPGWHIECSAMATKYLGNQFDIHCGGIDHIPVHHTNEIAQAEAASGVKPWVKLWMHGEFLIVSASKDTSQTFINSTHCCPSCKSKVIVKNNSEYIEKKLEDGSTLLEVYCQNCEINFSSGILIKKMSKSEGNFLRMQTLLDKHIDPLAYRYFLLQTHYRKQLTFSWEALEGATAGLERLKRLVTNISDHAAGDPHVREEFLKAINDDLNTPEALAVFWTELKNNRIDRDMAIEFDKILGLKLHEVKKETIEIPEEVQALLDERKVARTEKNWSESDRLRDEIAELGFTVKDTGEGQEVDKN
ncbi:MAG: cysteine--tRNA ligase [Candidatus Magasanikbacteria bacterium CG_4_9_14_0_2_um_filter_42_11]|uniref:Cysteine--tRNA ligase n=1 Tax=Candidatus Magasanikbacteria bacterium CG_4_9_14_0_2_um_filter_42_11 TaxID=1974643 RepID=A0A2M8F8H7_9BACT|nr:MAG: cysteine--tRNA ligase [Candidatus Magasanikbacteria bacterium CG10_big_fil_rev_8_21_14_0_10_43_9]PIY92958.1 MAG: cysteine--tRNA ligase [Candidatus Magasanikbacteria bacterium CG_4_10_14_0_8_um_filter_42_12]PJC52045.1 MAG: cysteine--tRNA ligase [Candidatus Magasanikbacteria bacterium CG_4_9_14_0_2_um_filter_42_11]